MNSYELIELCEHMPERGAFKTALRRGDPPESDLALYQIANELSILRAAQVPQVDSADLGSRLFASPSRMRELEIQAEEEKDALGMQYAIATRSEPE